MTLPAPSHRSIRIPRLMRLVRTPSAVIGALSELVDAGRPLLFAHTGSRSATGYGRLLADLARTAGYAISESVVETNAEPAVAALARAIGDVRPDAVVAVGGGRVVDVAKLGAARGGVEVVTIPTQMASDAICSPVATILNAAGRPQSLGAQMPSAIIIDLDVTDSAPRETWLAGLGDLVSNVSAVRDWRSAHATRGEAFDDFACLTAEAAALSVIEDDADLGDDSYRQKLIRGLILSGTAMEMAGSSRPASGSEHLISHALDQILARPRAHGLQVALSTIAASILRNDDWRRLEALYRRVGLPIVPADLQIPVDDFLEAVRLGPATRPDRTTCLDDVGEADLDRLRQAYDGLASR